jgi:glycosyltransferase involved in cell wall biosynthesis
VPLQGIVIKEYATFLENYPTTMICFVNDGSTDNTLGVLNIIKQDFPQQIHIVSLLKNSGKAEAVRQGTIAIKIFRIKTSVI